MLGAEEPAMTTPIIDLLARLRMRVEHVARTAGRFGDDRAQAGLTRLAQRLARVAASLAAPAARAADAGHRLEGQLERLARDVDQLRLDDPAALARAAWVLAEIDETLCVTTGKSLMPVYTAN
jgi:hypothetical protein